MVFGGETSCIGKNGRSHIQVVTEAAFAGGCSHCEGCR